ncbi:MAG: hypothetical protein FWD71_04725 [Oscillospiraceae bacterium]|nr:hypothetical protein [Oscillospiraceae bacterium]
MDNLTNEQNEQAAIKQDKRLFMGKIIIICVAVINILLALLTAVAKIDFEPMIIQIIFSVVLISRVAWFRYFFAIGAVINVIQSIYSLTANNAVLPTFTWKVIVLLISLVYLASSIMLFISKCVREYMRDKKNG